jgi:hypothetical protein
MLSKILTTQLTFRKCFSKNLPRCHILEHCNLHAHTRENFKHRVLYWHAFIILPCVLYVPPVAQLNHIHFLQQ